MAYPEKLLEEVAEERAKIVTVEHSRYDLSVPIRYASIDMALETQNYEHQERIKNKLNHKGYRLQE